MSRTLGDAGVDVPVRLFGVPDRFLDHGKRAEVLVECGLTAQDISRSIVETMAGHSEASEASEAVEADLPVSRADLPTT